MKRGETGCRLLTSGTEFPNYWGDVFLPSTLEYVRGIKRCAPHRQHREGTGMARWRELTQTPPYRAALLAFVAGMYWIWWDSFHEIGRFFMQTPLPFDFFLTRYSSISCAIKPVGVVLGCIAVCAVIRYCKELLATKRLPGILFACEVGLHVFYYLSAATGHYLVACFVYALISACIVVSIMIIALQMNAFEKRVIVLIVIGAIGCYGVFNNLVFPYVFRTSPLIVIGAVYLAALVAGYALSLSCSAQTLAFDEPNRESSVRTPAPLIVHLLVYGLAFGILHILGGYVAQGPYSINIAVFFACLVTIACLSFLFLRKTSSHEIWSKIRSTVFPLSVIGFLLIPLVSNSDAALALTEAGNLLYNAIFIIGCLTLMRQTYVDPRTIVAKGLLYKNLGTVVGVLWARCLYDASFVEGSAYSLLSVVIVLLLTIATFWVGSDERIRKIWGLRKNLSPKQFNDRMIQLKCEKISRECSLTTRESEMLLLLGKNMRAPEIADELGVSVDTVRSHIKHLYAKIDAHSLKDVHKLLKGVVVDEREIC